MSRKSLLSVFAALVALTMLTVFLGQLTLGEMEIWLTLLIASAKATLVATFFMHLAHDRPFNRLVVASSLVFVALFLALTLIDLTP